MANLLILWLHSIVGYTRSCFEFFEQPSSAFTGALARA